MSDALSPKQALFVQEYLKDLNGTQAAIRAGYSPASAASQASELLKVPKIAAALKAAQDARSERTEVTADRVLRELARIAFSDPAKAYAEDGRLLSVREMPEEARACLAGYDVEEGGDSLLTRKVKGWNKVDALKLLGQHLGMFKEKVEVSGTNGDALTIEVVTLAKAGG